MELGHATIIIDVPNLITKLADLMSSESRIATYDQYDDGFSDGKIQAYANVMELLEKELQP